ncbi:hypothetical protein BS329_20790 [Amycolatopsis coloradensis]|uniref:Uncharacterized protein n=1 Tax=Amycolatopsis coloradensis TaxID=76021 RepID=A0A1R0KR01_9PSEU|nr:hypothetical protein BS329_20790 [Amycolatopsis coloradensis]
MTDTGVTLLPGTTLLTMGRASPNPWIPLKGRQIGTSSPMRPVCGSMIGERWRDMLGTVTGR